MPPAALRPGTVAPTRALFVGDVVEFGAYSPENQL